MIKCHELADVRCDAEALHVTIDGVARSFRLRDVSSTLQNASDKERQTFEISPSGYGIHWPLLDEDISIDGLLGVVHAPSKKVGRA